MKKYVASSVIGVIAALTSLGASTASAGQQLSGEGTYAVTGVEVHSTTQVGAYTIVSQTLSIDNAGVLDGPSTADVICAFAATGTGTCAGVEQFSGSIGGRSGTATFAVGLTVDAAGFHGTFVSIDGDGGLEGLRGKGSFEGGATGTNDFTWSFH
jgi:hypothetical protein